MAKTVDAAFDILVERLKHSETETAGAAANRKSIERRLEKDFDLTRMFRSGSFGHGTSLNRFSDYDYFAVIPAGKLPDNSANALRKMRLSLLGRFPSTNIVVRSPAVVVPLASGLRSHDIIPAWERGRENGYTTYGIPNRGGGWMTASPQAHNAWVNAINDSHKKRVKQLIRLVKYWSYLNGTGIRSFYLELRTAEYAKSEQTILYKYDVKRVFAHLVNKSLASMQDPLGISGMVAPCTQAVKDSALSKVRTALTRATKAFEAEEKENHALAFNWWDKVYGGCFPGFY